VTISFSINILHHGVIKYNCAQYFLTPRPKDLVLSCLKFYLWPSFCIL